MDSGVCPATLTRLCWKMLLIQLVKVFSCIRLCCACSLRMWLVSYAESMVGQDWGSGPGAGLLLQVPCGPRELLGTVGPTSQQACRPLGTRGHWIFI